MLLLQRLANVHRCGALNVQLDGSTRPQQLPLELGDQMALYTFKEEKRNEWRMRSFDSDRKNKLDYSERFKRCSSYPSSLFLFQRTLYDFFTRAVAAVFRLAKIQAALLLISGVELRVNFYM